MAQKRLIVIAVVVAILAISNSDVLGSSLFIQASFGPGFMFDRHPCIDSFGPAFREEFVLAPPFKKVVVCSPHHNRFIWLGPMCHGIVVPPPCVEPVVVNPCPTVVFSSPVTVAEQTTVTVWFTNSNGSRSLVKLTKSGPWFVGPRGEWYQSMPTEEQLRVVYGF